MRTHQPPAPAVPGKIGIYRVRFFDQSNNLEGEDHVLAESNAHAISVGCFWYELLQRRDCYSCEAIKVEGPHRGKH